MSASYPYILVPDGLLAIEKQPLHPSQRPNLETYISVGLGLSILVLGLGTPLALVGSTICLVYSIWAYWKVIQRYQWLSALTPTQRRRFQIMKLPKYTVLEAGGPRRTGRYDQDLAAKLQTLPHVDIYQYQQLKGYTPSLILRDLQTALWICIEIDEPWHYTDQTLTTKQVCHAIGQDDQQDHFFLTQGWIVIHFAEQQVAEHPDGCLAEIVALLRRWDPSRPLPEVSLKPLKRWDHQEGLYQSRHYGLS